MNATLSSRIRNSNAHRHSRDANRDFILKYCEHLPELIQFAFTVTDKDSHKACWTLELVADADLQLFQIHVDFITKNIGKLDNESSIRPISKICQLFVNSHFSKKNKIIHLNDDQLQCITETAFDWLINDTKVAAKAYAMRTLYVLGNHNDWIHPELKILLEKDYRLHTAAYQGAAREILKKLP